jgi:hypothetical protein
VYRLFCEEEAKGEFATLKGDFATLEPPRDSTAASASRETLSETLGHFASAMEAALPKEVWGVVSAQANGAACYYRQVF